MFALQDDAKGPGFAIASLAIGLAALIDFWTPTQAFLTPVAILMSPFYTIAS